MRFDHIAVAAETLEDGVAWVEDLLGVTLLAGGIHARFATHNRLLGLANGLYLEVIAADPNATCDGPRWFGLDTFSGAPRVANWICEPTDFDAALVHGMRSVPMVRGDLRWDMGVPENGSLPMGGGFPTMLRWHTDTPPGQQLPASGCALKTLTVAHPDAAQISTELAANLGNMPVRFEVAERINLAAEIETPHGVVTL